MKYLVLPYFSLILFVFPLQIRSVHGQELSILEKELAYHADVMTNASEAAHRNISAKSFNELFAKTIEHKDSYNYPFQSLKWISIKEAQDKSFRLYAWNVQTTENTSAYYGYLQLPDGTYFKLEDGFDEIEDLANEELNPSYWLGGIYYNIMEMKDEKNQRYYMLFGFRKYNANENLKFVDVLYFDKNNAPIFGKQVFNLMPESASGKLVHRILTKYAADAHVTLNYNSGMEMIVTDNLARRPGLRLGEPETYVPDGTYVGYIYKKHKWNRVDRLQNLILETAPRPQPVLDKRSENDLFGKQKSKN